MAQVPVSFLLPVIRSMEQSPAAAELLGNYGLTTEELFQPDRKIDVRVFDAILQRSALVTANPAIGLVQGALVDLRHLGLVAWIVMNAGTIGEALEHFQHYNRIVCSGIDYQISPGPQGLAVRILSSVPGRVIVRPLADTVLRSFHHLLVQLAAEPVRVLRLTVEHGDEGDSQTYRDAFGVTPEYRSAANSLTFDSGVSQLPVRFSDAGLLAHFRSLGDQRLAGEGEGPVTARLRRFLSAGIQGRPWRIEAVARSLGQSVRSLQMHLKAEGQTFRSVAETVRREWSEAELRRSDLSIGEIAWVLGFSEQSAFQVWFKRWTRVTPLQFRKGKPSLAVPSHRR